MPPAAGGRRFTMRCLVRHAEKVPGPPPDGSRSALKILGAYLAMGPFRVKGHMVACEA